MKIGMAQMDILWEDIDNNMKKAGIFFQDAAKSGVDILVFPEMALTGFSMKTEELGSRWREQVTFFQEQTRKYHITTVFSCIVKEPDMKMAHNDLFIIEDGKVLMQYTKIHPFSMGKESLYYEGGDAIYSVALKDGTKVGGFICYDLRFGEIFSRSAEENQIIFVVANWPDSRILHWDRLLQGRAVEFQSFIVGVNRTGREPKLNYIGHSAVYGPNGVRHSEITEEESLIIAEIDPDEVGSIRKAFPYRDDRRPELYKKLHII